MIKEFNDLLLKNIKTYYMLYGCFYVMFAIVLYGFLLFMVPDVFFNVPLFLLTSSLLLIGFFVYCFFVMKTEQYDIEEKRTFFLTYMYVTSGFILVPLFILYKLFGKNSVEKITNRSNRKNNEGIRIRYIDRAKYNETEYFIIQVRDDFLNAGLDLYNDCDTVKICDENDPDEEYARYNPITTKFRDCFGTTNYISDVADVISFAKMIKRQNEKRKLMNDIMNEGNEFITETDN